MAYLSVSFSDRAKRRKLGFAKMDTFEPTSAPVAERSATEAMLPATRSAWLVEHLRQALLDGRYPPGSRLNEVHLSQELDVSRTPVRAALQTLAGEGLLHHQPNKGFTVREFLLTELVEAYDMRALAEGLAARLSAERGLSDETRRTIDTALSDGDRTLSSPGDLEAQRAAYAQMNQAFHGAIHAAAKSELVREVIRICQRVPQASARNVVAFDLGGIRRRHDMHHAIYHAILAREPQEAERLMREHVVSVKISMIENIARRGR
jgi:GntR family transcriptional regulator, vanillate catabolism transcriptional regulator